MRAVILIENEAGRPDLHAEHGLAVWLETGANSILFDTGASDALIENARVLGVDLSVADAIVLSHGHHDHTGGLATAAKAAPGAAIFVGQDATTPKYARRDEGIREIGVDHKTINAIAHRLRVAKDGQALVPGVTVLAEFGATLPLPEDNARLLVRGDAGMVADPFTDEIALVISTETGPVLVSGCSHRGIGNIVARAIAVNGALAAVIGGFHLHKETDERIAKVGASLEAIPRIFAGHCTGERAISLLRAQLGRRVIQFHGGSVIEIT